MDSNHQGKIIIALSLPLSILIILVSYVGLFTPDFYSKETLNWQAQSTGQDFIDLFLITPCLLITAFPAFRNNKTAFKLWGGVMLYLTYTFVIYCFEVHFNKLFIFYCLALGLSFYSFVYFLFTKIKKPVEDWVLNKTIAKITGIYFLIISGIFFFLWLSEIIPAIIRDKIPKSVVESGLFTNAVQVIDLSVFLPGIFITGVFLLRKKTLGYLFTPALLVFFILMDITIGVLVVIMKMKNIETDLAVAIVMSVLALISLLLLILNLKKLKTNNKQPI